MAGYAYVESVHNVSFSEGRMMGARIEGDLTEGDALVAADPEGRRLHGHVAAFHIQHPVDGIMGFLVEGPLADLVEPGMRLTVEARSP